MKEKKMMNNFHITPWEHFNILVKRRCFIIVSLFSSALLPLNTPFSTHISPPIIFIKSVSLRQANMNKKKNTNNIYIHKPLIASACCPHIISRSADNARLTSISAFGTLITKRNQRKIYYMNKSKTHKSFRGVEDIHWMFQHNIITIDIGNSEPELQQIADKAPEKRR